MGESMGPFVEGSAVLAATMDGVGIVEDDAFVRANEELAAAFGYDDPAALVGRPWRDLYPPSEHERIEDALSSVRAEGRWRGAVEGLRADGATTQTVLSVSEGDDGRLVWVVRETGESGPAWSRAGTASLDAEPRVTGRNGKDQPTDDHARSAGHGRQTPGRSGADSADEDEFRRLFETTPVTERTAERYEAIIEAVGDGVYVLDEDLEFTFVNEGLCELFGGDPDDLLGTSARRLFDDEDELAAADELRRQVVEGGGDDGTLQATVDTPDGERILEARYRLTGDSDDGFPGSVGVIRDVTDREQRERELRRQRTLIRGILNTIPDVVFAFDETGEPIVREAMLEEFAGYAADELAEQGPLAAIPEDQRAIALERIRRVLVDGETVSYRSAIETKAGERVPHEFRAAPLELEGETLGVVGSARDVTERIERERALERQRDELATLDRINELLLETARELIQTSSRDAVERTVCERLAASDLYRFAWVGEREFDSDRVRARASAGADDGYLEEVTITADETDTGGGPAGRALRTGEVQVANVSDETFGPWREAAGERGVESVAAVPLHHGETVYGVLVVYATREDAFSEREQAGFDVLGRTVGFVIHAARSREQLFADTVVELEFAVDDDSVLVETAAALDCKLSLEGYVAAGEGWLQYLTVQGAPASAVVDALAGTVERARIVGEANDGGRLELNVAESTLLSTATAAGGIVRSAEIDADGSRVTVQAPANADVRGVVEHVLNVYPGSELLAQREHDREVTTVGRPGGPLDALTDRQREILETAYRAGYYAWPRESTAEEVAEAVDIASPTLHGHLRKAEGAILSALFECRGG